MRFAPALLLLLLAACRGAMLPFETGTPPLVLVPARDAGVEDDRGRFREIVCAVAARIGDAEPHPRPCARILWRVGAEPPPTGRPVDRGPLRHRFRLVMVTGLGAQCFAHLVRMFGGTERRLAALGVRLERAPVTAYGSPEMNGRILAGFVRRLTPLPGERLVLLGYSKGVTDSLTALRQDDELRRRTAALVSLSGAVNGSPLAEAVPGFLDVIVEHLPGARCRMGDRLGRPSLRPRVRLQALAAAPPTPPVPVFSLVSFVPEEEVSALLKPFWSRLASADPRNDGLMLWYDQLRAGSTLLGYLRGDHLAVGAPIRDRFPWLGRTFFDHNDFPRIVLLEAVLRYLDERFSRQDGDRRETGRPPVRR